MTRSTGKTITFGEMRGRGSWDDGKTLQEFVANQLRCGRLAIVLGAGASSGFGLPDWDALIAAAYGRASVVMPDPSVSAVSAEILAEDLWRTIGRDDIRFAELIHDALYDSFDISAARIRQNDLLASVGAMVMASRRGSVRQVVSFNFDNVLETYLRYFGFDVDSPVVMPIWQSTADIRVLHPHGWLPYREAIIRGIVFTQKDYDRIVGDARHAWRVALLDVFRSHTWIFLGLSGRDQNLLQMIAEVKESHASLATHDAFWGVRFSKAGDRLRETWRERGVFPIDVGDWNEIPPWLFAACQRAAELAR